MQKNPFTSERNAFFEKIIQEKFPEIRNSPNTYYSLAKYCLDGPFKYYSVTFYEEVKRSIHEFYVNNTDLFVEYLISYRYSINFAIKNLEEINHLDFQDSELPNKDLELLNFIDTKIHFNYLKLLEGSYKHFLHLLAYISRVKRGKGIDGLDLYNCIEELKKSDIEVDFPYNNTIRNGIAHGGVEYQNYLIRYIDKKGNETEMQLKKIVSSFDELLDICNGINLSIRLFFLNNMERLLQLGVSIPEGYMIEELSAENNSIGWKILNSFKSKIIGGKPQLNIYIQNSFYDFDKVNLHGYFTAIKAEKYIKNFERINLSVNSSSSKFIGWANYNVENIRSLRKNNYLFVEKGKTILEDNLFFFIPKYKLPKFLIKIGTYKTALRIHLNQKKLEKVFYDKFTFRYIKFHSKGKFLVIEKCILCVDGVNQEEIRNKANSLIRQAIREKNKKLAYLSKLRFLKTKYIRLYIYDKNARIRELKLNGVFKNHICTIHMNRSTTIKNIMPKGIIEDFGNYQIIWNKKYSI